MIVRINKTKIGRSDCRTKKSYLSNQIRLLTFTTYDLFTDKEMQIYQKMVEQINEMNKLDYESRKNGTKLEKGIKAPFLEKKKQYQKELDEEIKRHAGTPRSINVKSVLDHKSYNQDAPPQGITWRTLKASRRIAEFASEMSRAMGLKHLDITFDKIILKWENRNSRTTADGKLAILKQVVLDGFDLPILHEDGTVEYRRFQFVTASAGQLRTNKIQCVSVNMWKKIEKRLMCGMTYEKLNEHGGINVGKLLAYQSLSSSATDEWDFDLNHAIVVKDFEAPVAGVMDYINQEYVITRGEREVMINHCDGIGMALPGVLPTPNAMARAPFIKGLLTTFDYLGFCAVNNCPAMLTDIYGVEHDLIAEDIRIIFTESQFKLHKYYDSWDHYKRCFVENGCHICLTNYEEEWIPDAAYNYQFMQALVHVTEEELDSFTGPEHSRIERLCNDQDSMLRTLNADAESENGYQKALAIYPELLRDGYSKETLRAIRKRRLLDAKSANFKCRNKRLFVIPDMYAACQFWFLNQERPEGLLKNGEVFAQLFWAAKEADILRSPSLSFEHAVRTFNHDPIVASWFTTNGIYTSCHDLISRVLQFDEHKRRFAE